jgi:predicted ATPase
LLHALLSHPTSGHFLVIGTYRYNEVDAKHPLAQTFLFPSEEEKSPLIERLTLEPLDLPELAELLQDTLRAEPDAVAQLARLVKEKTDGNPFFATQFLKSLHQQKLVQFDEATNRWMFQMETIAAAAITENVVDLMTGKIQRLSPASEISSILKRLL